MKRALSIGVLLLATACPPPEPPAAPIAPPAQVVPTEQIAMSPKEARDLVTTALGTHGRVMDVSCEAHHCLVTVLGEAARSRRAHVESKLKGQGLTMFKGRVTRMKNPEEWLWTLIVAHHRLSDDEVGLAKSKLASVLDAVLREYRPPREGF